MRVGVILFWSAVSVLLLVAVGVFGTLVATGRVTLFPQPESSAVAPPEVIAPVVDTSYPVVILNATTTSGLANAMRDTVVAAGWSADRVDAGDAGTTDFATTTVYYAVPEDEAAARGLADVIGGADVAITDAYPGTTGPDGAVVNQLTIVIGLDRAGAEAPADE